MNTEIVTQGVIDDRDRGLQYGDGFFTTILVENAQLQAWPLHCQRLLKTAEALYFPKLDIDAIYQRCLAELEQTNEEQLVLKILISRGIGGRGYGLPETTQPTILISVHPYPSIYHQWNILLQSKLFLD